MIDVDPHAIRAILAQVGEELLEEYGGLAPAASREQLIERFADANGWAERRIRQAVNEIHPGLPWSDAELDAPKQGSPEYGDAYWVLDPIDGAVHLHQGFGFWAISLCLIREGVAVFSAIYDAGRRELFHAVRGEGAYLNGERIRVSAKTGLADALLLTAPPNKVEVEPENVKRTAWSVGKLLPECTALRMLGSVALQMAYVACGRMDAYWEFGREIYDWLAGALLIEEAGGCVSDVDGSPFTWETSGVVAGPDALRDKIVTVLAG